MIIYTDQFCVNSKSVTGMMKRSGNDSYSLRIYPCNVSFSFPSQDELDKFYKELLTAMEKDA